MLESIQAYRDIMQMINSPATQSQDKPVIELLMQGE